MKQYTIHPGQHDFRPRDGFGLYGWNVPFLPRLKRAALVWLIMVFFLQVKGQSNYLNHLKKNAPAFGAMTIAGSSNGAMDVLRDKYSISVFPKDGAGRQYWDPAISWINKYKKWPEDSRPVYPGAKTWLVWTTDGWHAAKTVSVTSFQIAAITYRQPPPGKGWWLLVDLALFKIAFSGGWHLSNKLLTKQP